MVSSISASGTGAACGPTAHLSQSRGHPSETQNGYAGLCKHWRVQQGPLRSASSTLRPCTNNHNMVIAVHHGTGQHKSGPCSSSLRVCLTAFSTLQGPLHCALRCLAATKG